MAKLIFGLLGLTLFVIGAGNLLYRQMLFNPPPRDAVGRADGRVDAGGEAAPPPADRQVRRLLRNTPARPRHQADAQRVPGTLVDALLVAAAGMGIVIAVISLGRPWFARAGRLRALRSRRTP